MADRVDSRFDIAGGAGREVSINRSTAADRASHQRTSGASALSSLTAYRYTSWLTPSRRRNRHSHANSRERMRIHANPQAWAPSSRAAAILRYRPTVHREMSKLFAVSPDEFSSRIRS